jgi:hypothetical protein
MANIYVTSVDGMGAVSYDGSTYSTTGMKANDHMHIAEDFISTAGVVKEDDLEVTGKASRAVDVAEGTCYVLNDSFSANDGTNTRFWRVVLDGTEEVSIDANSSGNSRYTSIFAKIDTGASADDNASNVATMVAVNGTPAASPTPPATPANHLRLADVLCADGFTTTTGNVDDRRIYTGTYGGGNRFLRGWEPLDLTLTYASATTFTISGDYTDLFKKNTKVRLEQTLGTPRYFWVTDSSYSSPNTTVTVTGENDLSSGTIYNPYFSQMEVPYGMKSARDMFQARAYLSADQDDLTDDSENTVEFDSETYDYNSNFNTATYKYIAPISGTYSVMFATVIENTDIVADERYAIGIKVGSSYGTRISKVAPTVDFWGVSTSSDLYLSKGDEVTAFVEPADVGAAIDLQGSEDQTYICLKFVGL